MFGKLKNKLKNWADKFSKGVKEKAEKDSPEKPEEIKKKEIIEKIKPKEKVEPKEEIKGIETPMKFEVGEQKYEPDLEKLEEKAKEIEDLQPSSKEDKPSPLKEVQSDNKEKGIFSKIKSKITKVKIIEEEFNIYADELEMLLLENNVALEVSEKIVKELKEKIVGKELLKKEIEGEIKESFKDIIYEILIEPFSIEQKIKEKAEDQAKKPYVILFCGINGTGKTTSIAKIASSLKKKNISCVLAAADTFRAASIEQLKAHGEKLDIPVIAGEYESDPAAVSFDAIKYAEKNQINCVLIDTAGRMHTAKNLMAQIEKINRVAKPDLKIYVGESTTGNDAVEQVKSFNFSLNIDGIILSKADIDEKGGTALSVGYVTKKPILYLGTGQEYNKIEPFDKEKFIERLGL
tara:strand:- start:4921 stop:6138 length:1218 start_codon:yes stop_codon:yes gene_type:complete